MRNPLTPARLRLILQSAFCLYCLWIGLRFFLFLSWAQGRSETFVPRPSSVEGFLPIAAFMALKQWITTGLWDQVHPAGLAILLAAIVIALVLRKGFCAVICPVGFAHNLMQRAGRALGLTRRPGPRLSRIMAAPKYLMLGFFAWTIWVNMPAQAIRQFLNSPYNFTADARMLDFFLSPSTTALAILVLLAVLALIVPSFWCRTLCPYGALLGLVSLFSPVAVHRDGETCVDCGRCNRACPSGIDVRHKDRVGSPECIGCMQCVDACPVPHCLEARAAGKWRVPPLAVLGGVVVLLVLAWAVASATGHWDNTLPQTMLRRFYMMGG